MQSGRRRRFRPRLHLECDLAPFGSAQEGRLPLPSRNRTASGTGWSRPRQRTRPLSGDQSQVRRAHPAPRQDSLRKHGQADTQPAREARRSAGPDTAQKGMPISTQQKTLRQVTALRAPPGKARRNRSDLCHGRNAARTARDQAVRRHQSRSVVDLLPSFLERGRSKPRKTGDRVIHFQVVHRNRQTRCKRVCR